MNPLITTPAKQERLCLIFDERPVNQQVQRVEQPLRPRWVTGLQFLPGITAKADDPKSALPSPFGEAKPAPVQGFWTSREKMRAVNAVQHQEEGQNILFLDSHVQFEKGPICGINEDNVWTRWNGGDIRVGAVPAVAQPINVTENRRQDSVLVTDGEGADTPPPGPGPR